MKYSAVFSALVLSSVSFAVPTKRDDTVTDVDVLNFALTLEHLESTYYSKAMEKYSQQDFIDAGFQNWAHDRFTQIAAHEKTHVQFLADALGDQAVQPCEYKFPDKDVKSFVTLSNMLEQVGVSAYIGAAKYIENKAYLTAAGTILSVEARHAAWVGSAVRKGSAWSSAFDIPLSLNQVFTIASSLIDHCPSSNPQLPVNAFPALSVVFSSSTPQSIDVAFTPTSSSHKPLYAAYLTSTGVIFTPLKDVKHGHGGSVKAKAMVPPGLFGYIYVVITDNEKKAEDDNTMAGPAVLEFGFDSKGNVAGQM